MKKTCRLLILVLVLLLCSSILFAEEASGGVPASFCFDFYRAVSSSEENILFSPLSVSMVFSMVHAGTAGNTAQQIARTFGFKPDSSEQAEYYKGIIDSIRQINSGDTSLLLSNSLWPQKGEINPEYTRLIENVYHGRIFPVDYRSNAPAVTEAINKYVRESTAGNIKRLLKYDLDSETVFTLLNVIYFKDSWLYRFNESSNMVLEFHIDEDHSVETIFMHQESPFNYYEDEFFQAVELPYNTERISMLIILPRGGEDLQRIEQGLSFEQLEGVLGKKWSEPVSLYLPRFELESDLDLKLILSSMGITDAFNLAKADFSNMSGERLCIGFAKHAARIKVNEEGSEAAAATVAGGCFPAGTLVLTAGGPVPIEEIEPGTPVRSFNFKKDVWEEAEVTALHRFDNNDAGVELSIEGSFIRATSNHPFYVLEGEDLQTRRYPADISDPVDDAGYGGRWVEAGELRPGDLIKCFGVGSAVVDRVKNITLREPVYNLAVDGHHNFTVGSCGALVHNKDAQEESPVMFYANRPFIFIIRDNLTGEIYFMGRLSKPGQVSK